MENNKLDKAVNEIMELIKLLENDMEVITDPDDYKQRLYEIDGLYDALKILGGETAEEVY
jgi:hypothetical protein